jgi:hypothetical protein
MCPVQVSSWREEVSGESDLGGNRVLVRSRLRSHQPLYCVSLYSLQSLFAGLKVFTRESL